MDIDNNTETTDVTFAQELGKNAAIGAATIIGTVAGLFLIDLTVKGVIKVRANVAAKKAAKQD